MERCRRGRRRDGMGACGAGRGRRRGDHRLRRPHGARAGDEQAVLRPRGREVAVVTAATFDPVKRSPSHHQHAALGARFAREAGWDVPSDYGSVDDERQAVTEGAAVADVTARGKVDLRGDLAPAIASLAGRRALVPGAVLAEGTRDGGFHLARVSSRWALALCRPDSLERCLAHAEGATGGGEAMATDVTSLYAGFALFGPGAVGVLSRLTAFDIGRLDEG